MIDSLLVDTSIVINALQGSVQVSNLLEQRKIFQSFISEIELYSWPNLTEPDKRLAKSFIKESQVIDYSSLWKSKVIEVRKAFRLKMSGALVAATAIQYDLPLVSADRIFSKVNGVNFLKVIL